MEIKQVTEITDEGEGGVMVFVNGKIMFDVSTGEPEDMTMWRELAGLDVVADLMKLAYEAGKNGEELKIEKVKGEV